MGFKAKNPKLHTVQADNRSEVYTHSMYQAIDNYILEHDNIDLVHDITQYQWKSVLYYIHDNCFPDRSMLKRTDRDNNSYDYDLLSYIYDIYKRLCMEYNKITMLSDFSILTGIDDDLITSWSNGTSGNKLNTQGSRLHRKIMRDNETAVSTTMISSGRNPVGYMAILNHYHGWNMPSTNNGDTEKRRTQEEIAAAHGLAVENSQQKAIPAADFLPTEN